MKTLAIVLILLLAGGAAWYYWDSMQPDSASETLQDVATPAEPVRRAAPDDPAPAMPSDTGMTQPAQLSDSEPAITEEPLPLLQNSDQQARRTAAELIGDSAAVNYLVTESVIPKLVAAIDALSGRQVPSAMMPVQAPGGEVLVMEDAEPPQVMTTPEGDTLTQYLMDPANSARYSDYVGMLESLDAADIERQYSRYESLFQQAYDQLGYDNADFSEQLLTTIDEMLAAPDVEQPVRLIKPEAYYLFADPELEALSAGQKMMIRMGPENAARVRAKLVEIREVLAEFSKS